MVLRLINNNAKPAAARVLGKAKAAVDTTSSRTRDAASSMRGRMNGLTKEARERAGATRDAISGHRPGRSWGLIAAAAATGVGIGVAATSAVRRMLHVSSNELDQSETTPTDRVDASN
jgi:hypothetical protein